jgi:type I restriction enzyme S subunit
VDKGVISPAYYTLRFKKESGIREYFKYLLKTHYYREHYKIISQGTNVRRRKAPIQTFLKLKVHLPDNIDEQKRIVEILQTCDEEINLLNRKLFALEQQKKGLMQELLTGQIRVKV